MKRSRLRRSPTTDQDKLANAQAIDRLEQASMTLEKRFKIEEDD